MKAILLSLIAASAIPIYLTAEELSDKWDDSKTTRFQPELVTMAWAMWIMNGIGILTGKSAQIDTKKLRDELNRTQE